jgi:hypothetical protein
VPLQQREAHIAEHDLLVECQLDVIEHHDGRPGLVEQLAGVGGDRRVHHLCQGRASTC